MSYYRHCLELLLYTTGYFKRYLTVFMIYLHHKFPPPGHHISPSNAKPSIYSMLLPHCISFYTNITKAAISFTYMLSHKFSASYINPYPTAFPYGNGTVLHFYQQQESSRTKTVHKVINKGLKSLCIVASHW